MSEPKEQPSGAAGQFARLWINSKLTPLVIVASVLLGIFSVWQLPREEEPQISVPMIDVFVEVPGAAPQEVSERVCSPLEKLFHEIPGVEYVYSTSSPGQCLVIVRFLVAQDFERSLVRVSEKLTANADRLPREASRPLVKARSIEDVPILALTLSSSSADDFALRRLAVELSDTIQQTPNVSMVSLIGGRRREVKVYLKPEQLSAVGLSPLAVVNALGLNNQKRSSGEIAQANQQLSLEAGEFLQSAEDVGAVVVGVNRGAAIYLRDVARIEDGGAEPTEYVRFSKGQGFEAAVTIAVSKRASTNAVQVAEEVLGRIEALRGVVIPHDVSLTITRHYGETAQEKSNELLEHMAIAVVSVSVLIALILGLRESLIVFLAIPVTLALTLTVFHLYGYTLNRITLFALIFSIGILVDDAIVVVENIVRHWQLPANSERSRLQVAIQAVNEVGNPTILATLAVVSAILPMAFVGGLMGPYMRPIPIGATAAMLFSLLVAFLVTPYAAVRILKREATSKDTHAEDWSTRFYRKVMASLLHDARSRWVFLGTVAILLIASCSLFYFGAVKVKMLPFDNKSEFQVIIDMPNGSTLEQTARVAQELSLGVQKQREVVNIVSYVGTASPYNFNGLVRHYYLRSGAHVADLQVNLLPKQERQRQSHEIAQEVRARIAPIAKRFGARIKVAEVPPGPPVLATLVAEVYGPDAKARIATAGKLRDLFRETNGVVDVDWYVEDPQRKLQFVVDKVKAAQHGLNSSSIAETLALAVQGTSAGVLHVDRSNSAGEKEDVPIRIRLDRATRSQLDGLLSLRVSSVPLREVVRVEERSLETSIYHKNLLPVTYVTADVAGAMESPIYAMLALGAKIDLLRIRQRFSGMPTDAGEYEMKWDGEWQVTYEVFRDLGIAFAAVLILIYGLMVGWFQSFVTPLIIMLAIPFSLVGILPAHALLGAFFTATTMIGFIAGAGIVVRNSIILVDFIELRLAEGLPLAEAVSDAGAVRFRPMMLTAAAVVVGASVILFDPIFQGLAIALMAGEIASLLLSRIAVPVFYYLVYKNSKGRIAQ